MDFAVNNVITLHCITLLKFDILWLLLDQYAISIRINCVRPSQTEWNWLSSYPGAWSVTSWKFRNINHKGHRGQEKWKSEVLRELLILVANMHKTFICSAVILLLLKKLLNINFIESLFTTFWIIEIDNTYHKQHRHHKSLVIPYDHSCWNSFFSTNTLNFY